eukprot:m.124567 g.124567  ORF g.124567 m.124567 type:complete len:580 (-) comp29065_c0_seq7:159-1898(-)
MARVEKVVFGSLMLLLHSKPSVAYDNGSPNNRLPPLGWSSWEGMGAGDTHPIRDYCDTNSVIAAADAFHTTGLYDAGYRHFHLDDCWSISQRNATGFIQADPARFPPPGGIKAAIDYVHSKNLTFGLYTCGGKTACMSSRAGSRGHWVQDANVFAEWEVDWVKMDWCGGSDILGSYGNMSKALNATGRAMGFNMCEWGSNSPWVWGNNYSQSWRISGDHAGTWASIKSAIAQSAKIAKDYSGRPYGWNDMDMLQTGNGAQSGYDPHFAPPNMSLAESITEFSMWAISASPMLVTTPIMNCTAPPNNATITTPVQPRQPRGVQHREANAGALPCSVTLTKQMSIANCTKGVSFGCIGTLDDKKMWINGCRGVFECDGVVGVMANEMCHTWPKPPCNFTIACTASPPPPPPCGNYTTETTCDEAGSRCHWNPPDGTPNGDKCVDKPKPPPPPPVGPNPPKHNCVPMLNAIQKIVLLNTEVIAINQDTTPQGAPLSQHDTSVWARNMTDGSVAVALYNADDEDKLIGIPCFSALGWKTTAKATVRDLWAHTENGTVTGTLPNVTVGAHATVVLQLTPVPDHS